VADTYAKACLIVEPDRRTAGFCGCSKIATVTRLPSMTPLLPNEKADERILLIYGIYTQGSQAAIEYATTEKHLNELHRALTEISDDKKTPPPLFQALIETSVENWVPGRSRLVGVRAIPDQRK